MQKLKHTLKLLACCSLLLLSACEKEIYDDAIYNENISLRKITFSELKHNKQAFTQLKKAKLKRNKLANYKSVYNEDFGVFIDTTRITLLESNGKQSITMKIENDEDPNKIENLVLAQKNDGSYDAFITTYILTQQEVAKLYNGENLTYKTPTSLSKISSSSVLDWIPSSDCIDTQTIKIWYCRDEKGNIIYDDGYLGDACNGMSWPEEEFLLIVDLNCLNTGTGSNTTSSNTGSTAPTSGTSPTGGTGTGSTNIGSNSNPQSPTTQNPETENSNPNPEQQNNNSLTGGLLTMPVLTLPQKTPCEELTIKSSQQNFKNAFNALNTQSNYSVTHESGYGEIISINQYGATSKYFTPLELKGDSSVALPNTNTVIGGVHVHQDNVVNPEEIIIKIFSPADIKGLLEVSINAVNDWQLDRSYSYIMMLSSQCAYAIKISDSSFDMDNAIFANNWDNLKKEYIKYARKKFFDNDGNFNPTQSQLQELFFDTLKNAGLQGKIELYKATNFVPNTTNTPTNITPQWARVNPTTFALEPCN